MHGVPGEHGVVGFLYQHAHVGIALHTYIVGLMGIEVGLIGFIHIEMVGLIGVFYIDGLGLIGILV
jgi:hypothetical protein